MKRSQDFYDHRAPQRPKRERDPLASGQDDVTSDDGRILKFMTFLFGTRAARFKVRRGSVRLWPGLSPSRSTFDVHLARARNIVSIFSLISAYIILR